MAAKTGAPAEPGTESAALLALPDGRRIAYRHRAPAQLTRGCAGIMFLCGFRSDMTGTKAEALAAHARRHTRPLLRFDYSGHGQSEGRFE